MERENKAVSAASVLEELAAIGFARITDYLTVRDGQLEIRSMDALPPQGAAAVASVERTSTGLKIKFYDKLRALELLGKSLGLFDAGAEKREDSNLLQIILEATGREVSMDALQEPEQAADACHDLVEPSEIQNL